MQAPAQFIRGHVPVDLALLELVHKMGPDLTVMAARARKGFTSFSLGA